MSDLKVYSFKLDPRVVGYLDRFKTFFGSEITRSQALRQSVTTTATLTNEAMHQTVNTYDWMVEKYGQDALLVCPLRADADGNPVHELTIDGREVDDIVPVWRVHPNGDRVFLYLLSPSGPTRYSGEIAVIGDTMIYIAAAMMSVFDAAWPPNPKRPTGLVARLGDLAGNPESSDLYELVEA